MTTASFFCTRDHLRIRGMQFYPENFKEGVKYPAIIFSHGFTSNYLATRAFCEKFAQEGYATFCFGFCGGGRTGEVEDLRSEGDTRDMSLWTEVEDLLVVKDYVKSLNYVDSSQLILAGFSQGGFVSGLAAAKCGLEISKLIMVYPALCIPDHARMGGLGGSSYDIHQVPEEIICPNSVLGRKFHEEVVGMDPYLELRPYQGPVLLLQGLEDPVVNYSYAIRAKENYGKGQCHLQLIREMGHNSDDRHQSSIMASIRQFLNDRNEVLTIRVLITHSEKNEENNQVTNRIYFIGYCDNEYFHGTIVPEGCDTQRFPESREGNEVSSKENVRAEYTLEGLDCDGKHSHIHIVNQWGNLDWEPMIETDSEALAWMNHASFTAVLEYAKEGPVVRIFSK